MGRKEEIYEPALENKKIPVLTLDHKWHMLFDKADTNAVILKLADQLNVLLKRQGKLNTESKEIRRLKKRLMEEIVPMVDELGDSGDTKLEKKIEDNKRLINECNDKLDAYKEELLTLPGEIEQVNYKLMIATMEACYDKLRENTAEIEEIGEWITAIRIELKKKIIRKQEKEQKNYDLYSYMHAIFGAEVINIFDMKYNPEEQYKIPSKKEGEKASGSENAKKAE
ncbi:MAG: hypothetical protein UFG06_03600 [Lachnospiraceae bacterium]|nr:hypothetical protein [Lachnospiraceae bacterium]